MCVYDFKWSKWEYFIYKYPVWSKQREVLFFYAFSCWDLQMQHTHPALVISKGILNCRLHSSWLINEKEELICVKICVKSAARMGQKKERKKPSACHVAYESNSSYSLKQENINLPGAANDTLKQACLLTIMLKQSAISKRKSQCENWIPNIITSDGLLWI